MDLPGAEWPFWVQLVMSVAAALALWVSAWRWGGRDRPASAKARGVLLWWMLAVVPWLLRDEMLALAARGEIYLPGSTWEYVPPPTDPVELVLFIVPWALVTAVMLGAPLAALLATGRVVWTSLVRHSVPPESPPPRARAS